MHLDSAGLAALVAAVDHGTFEAAARALHITPSAFSQRIKALEGRTGQVLLRRTRPCRATAAGEPLVRLARQVRLLEVEALRELTSGAGGPEGSGGWTEVPLAINADSLATWFEAVLDEAPSWGPTLLDIHIEDEDHSAALLRSGDVMGAVTTSTTPVQGCSAEPLGSMRYVAAAHPRLLERHRTARGRVDLAAMPYVRFGDKDDLQEMVLEKASARVGAPAHVIPSNAGFFAAVRAGLGWGAVPETQLAEPLASGGLVPLGRGLYVDVPLTWQRWRLPSATLDRISDSVRAAARVLR